MNRFYNTGYKEILDGTIDLSSDTIKVIPVGSGYTFNPDHTVADAGGANDVVDEEIVATNYTGGWGGSGRKTLSNKSWSVDNTNDMAVFDADPITWSSLGGATNDTINAFIIVKEGGANDTTTRLIAYVDTVTSGTLPLTTNGSDVTITPDADGLFQFPT